MSAIIPFDGSAKLPAYLSKVDLSAINRDVVSSGPAFAVLSIKGKVFTLVKGSEKKVLTREVDGEEEVVQSLQVSVVRANTKSRVFYAKAYTEGDSDGAKPTCFSHDGITPDPSAAEKQCNTCQGCPQNVWGVRDGKGTACAVNTRLAIVDPSNLGEPFLLRVPAASRAGFNEVVKAAENRKIPYNAMVLRISFDKEAPAPKLVFSIRGLLDDATYEKVNALYDDETTKGIVGVHEAAAALPAPTVDTSELDAAIAAKAAVKSAAAKAQPKPAPTISADEIDDVVEKPKAAPKKVEKPAPAGDDLMADLDALLGQKDD